MGTGSDIHRQAFRLATIFFLVLSEQVMADVNLPDPAVRVAVRVSLGKAPEEPITRNEMARLTSLDLTNAGVRSLEGLEFATGLISLYLNDNDLVDIRSLSALTTLRSLQLDRTGVTDLNLMTDLDSLVRLSVVGNGISDVSDVWKLSSLRYLDLGSNALSDLSALRWLTQLTSLYVDQNRVLSIEPLAALENLQELDIRGNPVQDLHSLSGMSDLSYRRDSFKELSSHGDEAMRLERAIGLEGASFTDYVESPNRLEWLIASESTTSADEPVIVDGTDGDDFLTGTDGRDIINGGGGDDILIGLAGDDRLGGGSGYDILDGGEGNDLLSDPSGWGELRGGSGDDRLYGRGVFIGGPGADILFGFGYFGDHSIEAIGSMADYSESSDGVAVEVNGVAGTGGDAAGDTLINIDALVGSMHQDVLYGNGRTWIFSSPSGDVLGRGSVSYDGSDSEVTVDLETGIGAGGHAEGDTLEDIVDLIGSELADSLLGNAISNTIWGRRGNDTILGRDGDDVLHGQEGADTLSGGLGDDILHGQEGADTLSGGLGDDVLHGQEGADTLSGGLGADLIYGGSGHDIADYTSSDRPVGAFVEDLRHGNEHILRFHSTVGHSGGDLVYGIESIWGSAHDDVMHLPSSGVNWLQGKAGDDALISTTLTIHDVLSGGIGNDLLHGGGDVNGGGGDDTLTGSFLLNGGEGNDRLFCPYGGPCIMHGGPGADVFVIAGTHNVVPSPRIISDFEKGEDSIHYVGYHVPDFEGLIITDEATGTRVDANLGESYAIYLVGIPGGTLDASDFMFVKNAVVPMAEELVDIDSDGDADYCRADALCQLNLGNGRTESRASPGAYFRDMGIQLGDVDGDGSFETCVLSGDIQNPVNCYESVRENYYQYDRNEVLRLVDIDGDGDLDKFVRIDDLVIFEATGTTNLSTNPIEDWNFGWRFEFADVDNDGDEDFISDGKYFENVGTPDAPEFVQRSGNANPLPRAYMWPMSQMNFGDMDSDGDLDLIVGGYGPAVLYLNDGSGGFSLAVVDP